MKYLILLFLFACNSQEKPNPLIFFINNPSEKKVVESVKPTEEQPSEEIQNEEIPVEIQTPIVVSLYKNNYVYLFDSNNNIVYESEILNSQTIQGYQLQADMMNAFNDPLCPCRIYTHYD
jgi:hypothetical protein